MPKLSAYLQKVPDGHVKPKQQTQGFTGHHLPSQGLQQQQAPAEDTARACLLEQFRTQHNRRLQERGPRQYRLADGSLGLDLPPANPFAVASRAVWHGLVTHCRSQGADPHCEAHGYSLRHFINVKHVEHATYLDAAGLRPEQDPEGRFLGLDPRRMDPLADAAHPFRDASSMWHQADERALGWKLNSEVGA